MIDLHLHTNASHDGAGDVEEYCEVALSKNIRVIAITNHLDLEPGLPHLNPYQHAPVLNQIAAARAKYGDRLSILVGIEVGYQSGIQSTIADILHTMDADIVLGSVHIVGGPENVITEEHGAHNYFTGKLNPRDAFMPYFDEVLRAVKSGLFDVIAHIDVIRRYGESMLGPLKPGEYYPALRRIFEGMVKRDMALEVNSSGLHHAVRDTYPSCDILKFYHELGGRRVTIGSDAHIPENAGRDIDHSVNLLKSLGFREATVFERRIPKQVPLP